MQHIAGTQRVLANLAKIGNEIVERVSDATEKAAVRVGVTAATGHEPGFGHAIGRYENQTTTLTRSLLQAPVAIKVDGDEVIYSTGSNIEYAMPVEAIYPFLWPAAVANKTKFRELLAEALGQ